MRHAYTPLTFVIVIFIFCLPVSGQDLPAFSIQKAQGICQQIQAHSKEFFQSPTLEMRYKLLYYYLKRLEKDSKSFPVADVLGFALSTRTLTLRSSPKQPLLDAWKELDRCFREMAQSQKLEYEALPEQAYRARPEVPTDPRVRKEELTFAIFHLRASLDKLQRDLGPGSSAAHARLQADLQALTSAASEIDAALRTGQLSEHHFANFQIARARWEISRPLLPLLSNAVGIEISQLNQTCCELWRGGK